MNDQQNVNQEFLKLGVETTALLKEMKAEITELKADRDAITLLLRLLVGTADVTLPSPVSVPLRNQLRELLDGSQPHAQLVLEKCIALLPPQTGPALPSTPA